MRHFLLVGHAGAKPRLAAIAAALKSQSARMVSVYTDDHLDLVNERRGFPAADVLVLALCRESRDQKSRQHDVEADLVRRASVLRPPLRCVIICDEDGHVSAPFLVTLGAHVVMVVAHEQNMGCNVTEICENALPLYVPDVVANAGKIADALLKLRPVARTYA